MATIKHGGVSIKTLKKLIEAVEEIIPEEYWDGIYFNPTQEWGCASVAFEMWRECDYKILEELEARWEAIEKEADA